MKDIFNLIFKTGFAAIRTAYWIGFATGIAATAAIAIIAELISYLINKN